MNLLRASPQQPIVVSALALLLPVLLITTALALLIVALGQAALAGRDRHQIAFYSYRDDAGAIYLMDVERMLRAPIYRTSYWVVSMGWSPDGSRLAFVTYENGYYILYTLDADTLAARRLTDQTASNKRPLWSPDGRWVVFESMGYSPFSALFIVDSRGGRPHDLMRDANGGSADLTWAADGKSIVLATIPADATTYDLYIIDATCLNHNAPCTSRRLTTNSANDRAPAWSPEDGRIAFISDRGGASDVYITGPECVGLTANCAPLIRRLTSLGIAGTALAWSPSGRWLTFEVWPNGIGSVIFAIDMDCLDQPDNECRWLQQLTSANDAASNPDWSPDGREIAFISRTQGTVIALLEIESCLGEEKCERHIRRLTSADVTSWYPVWRPNP